MDRGVGFASNGEWLNPDLEGPRTTQVYTPRVLAQHMQVHADLLSHGRMVRCITWTFPKEDL